MQHGTAIVHEWGCDARVHGGALAECMAIHAWVLLAYLIQLISHIKVAHCNHYEAMWNSIYSVWLARVDADI